MTVRFVATDLETGDTSTVDIQDGNFCIVAVNPCYVAGEQHHANGTTVITVKGRTTPVAPMRDVSPTVEEASDA